MTQDVHSTLSIGGYKKNVFSFAKVQLFLPFFFPLLNREYKKASKILALEK